MKRSHLFVAVLLGVALSASAQKSELLVAAAGSLTEVLTSLAPRAEVATGAKMVFNFAASGTLRKQIEFGAPVDVFFSAGRSDMDDLESKGLIVAGSRVSFLSNTIVLVASTKIPPLANLESLRALLAKADLLAIGNPDTVAAGRYAVQALQSLGLYGTVAKKLVFGGTVREVLQYVESDSAPLGIVFSTDALLLKPDSSVSQVFRFPDDSLTTPIVYPIAVVAASKNREKSLRLIEFLRSDISKEVFRKAGFIVK